MAAEFPSYSWQSPCGQHVLGGQCDAWNERPRVSIRPSVRFMAGVVVDDTAEWEWARLQDLCLSQ